jgi:predicted enzyme related to lactoylglutathione lyase
MGLSPPPRANSSEVNEMANPVTWFEIIGGDGIGLHGFYKNVFGWKLSDPMAEMRNYSMLDNEGHGIGGGVGAEMPGQGGRVTVYIEVNDPQAYLDKVTASGGTMIMPVTDVTPEVTIAMFTDPAGNVVGLLKGDGSH